MADKRGITGKGERQLRDTGQRVEREKPADAAAEEKDETAARATVAENAPVEAASGRPQVSADHLERQIQVGEADVEVEQADLRATAGITSRISEARDIDVFESRA